MNKLVCSSKLSLLFIVLAPLLMFTVGCSDTEDNHKIHNSNNDINVENKSEWINLFDGKSLNNWTAKFKGYPAGVNYKNTFKVVDGLLTVDYSNYQQFNGEFGHLFYKMPFSHYILKATYRFNDDQISLPASMKWAHRNNGFMIHAQSVESMELDQDFPTSIEVQLLGGNGQAERSTLNLCTPNSDVEMDGKLITKHCIDSTSKTFHGNQWVTVEVEVRGDEVIRHKINGETVLEYQHPQLDAKSLAKYKSLYHGKAMKAGYIAIQAETHPTQFKSIQLKVIQ